MTYQEALEEIKKHEFEINQSKNSKFNHKVEACVILPKDADILLKSKIVYEIINSTVNNNISVLESLDLFNKELFPYIVYQRKGESLLMTISEYLLHIKTNEQASENFHQM